MFPGEPRRRPPAAWATFPRGTRPGVLRVLLFPCAGGGAAMWRAWPPALPGLDVGLVNLPGREGRMMEPALRSIPALADAALAGLRPFLQPPFALAGHSMGGLLAYEVARRLAREGSPGPDHLVAMAYQGPHLPPIRVPSHRAPDARLREEMVQLSGTPREVLEHPELLDLLLPVLRADLEAVETYVHAPGPPLACPVTAYAGSEDPIVPPAMLEGWAQHTAGPFRLRVFKGHHFFVQQAEVEVLAAVAEDLARAGPQR